MLPIILIAGPTGSGKTALALRLAEHFGGEIVNCDSLQFYRGFDIGTAKTPPDVDREDVDREDVDRENVDRENVDPGTRRHGINRRGIPHHLFDVLAPQEGYSAGEYARAAREVLAEVSSRRRLPIVVGGTGFYMRALLHGLPVLPPKSESLRPRLLQREMRRPGSLHKLLSRLDPESAKRIHANDVQKLIRAMELRLLTRASRPAPELADPLDGYHALIIGLDPDRARLRERLSQRTRQMFTGGLLEEVRDHLARGLSGGEKPFEALGYKQALNVLQGRCSIEQAIESTTIATHQYAKRQLTWFRRDKAIQWLHGFGEESTIQQSAIAIIEEWLLKSGRETATRKS